MSELRIRAEADGGRTVITDHSFSAPLKIARPFYHGGMTEIMQMSASAGLLEGDEQDIRISVGENAVLRYTGQSFTKIFRAREKGAVQRVRLSVHAGGCLIYLPPPVIPFAGSRYQGFTEVFLEKGSRFFGWDIVSCGRAGMEERFAWTQYSTRFLVCLEGKPVCLEAQQLDPAAFDPGGIGGFEGYSHIGTAYLYGAEEVQLPAHCEAAASRALAGFCIRAAGNSAEEILNCFQKITINGGEPSWLVF